MSSESTPLLTKPGTANGSSWVGRATIAVFVVASVACLGFLGYHSDALLNNRQYMLGAAVEPLTVCPSGKMQFHSLKKEDAYCTDAGAGGIVCGPSTAGAMETFTVKTLDTFSVLKGPRDNKYCLHEPDHFPKCVYVADSKRVTGDFAPFSLTRSADDATAYAIRLGSSGYCTNGARDVLRCDTSWMDKWETFKVTCSR